MVHKGADSSKLPCSHRPLSYQIRAWSLQPVIPHALLRLLEDLKCVSGSLFLHGACVLEREIHWGKIVHNIRIRDRWQQPVVGNIYNVYYTRNSLLSVFHGQVVGINEGHPNGRKPFSPSLLWRGSRPLSLHLAETGCRQRRGNAL